MVYTGTHNDSPLLKSFHLDEKQEKDIRENFQQGVRLSNHHKSRIQRGPTQVDG